MYGHKRVRERRNDALTRVGWEQLEVLLATWYRGQGYEVEHSGTGASGSKYDGGIDLKLRRPGEYALVQIKHWNAYKVPHNDVHQLLGLMVNEGATDAILITSGEFTKAAIEAATRHGHVRLIDGNELRAMLGPLPEPVVADRFRGEGRRGHRVAGEDARQLFAKGIFALLALLLIVYVFNGAMHSVLKLAQRPASASVMAPPSQRTTHVVSGPSVTQSDDPCREVIDKPSGTYINDCAPLVIPKPPTSAEIRASRRKADDAIKVLAPNTPEM
jgi:hypothetical protein